MPGASGGGWPPPIRGLGAAGRPVRDREACLAEAGLPGVARDDISAGPAGQELAISIARR